MLIYVYQICPYAHQQQHARPARCQLRAGAGTGCDIAPQTQPIHVCKARRALLFSVPELLLLRPLCFDPAKHRASLG